MVEHESSGRHWYPVFGKHVPADGSACGPPVRLRRGCSVHDQALGRANTYHLFRLPPGAEDHLEDVIAHIDWSVTWPLVSSRETAMESLKILADTHIKAPEGPVQVGVQRRLLTSTAIKELAAHYHSAFTDGIRCFPYFGKD